MPTCQALRLTRGQGRRAAPEAEVAEADVEQYLCPRCCRRICEQVAGASVPVRGQPLDAVCDQCHAFDDSVSLAYLLRGRAYLEEQASACVPLVKAERGDPVDIPIGSDGARLDTDIRPDAGAYPRIGSPPLATPAGRSHSTSRFGNDAAYA